jgi:hypothetical protein
MGDVSQLLLIRGIDRHMFMYVFLAPVSHTMSPLSYLVLCHYLLARRFLAKSFKGLDVEKASYVSVIQGVFHIILLGVQ